MNVFMVRLATDIILWVFIIFGTIREMEITGVIDIDGGEDTTEAKDYEQHVDFHASHFVLLGFLILKEIFIYFVSVRRATYKLSKEFVPSGPTTQDKLLRSD